MFLSRELEPYPSTCRKLVSLANLGMIDTVSDVIHDLASYTNIDEQIVLKYKLTTLERETLQWMIDYGRGILVFSKDNKNIIQSYIEHSVDDFPILILTSKKHSLSWYRFFKKMYPDYKICVINSKSKDDNKYESKFPDEGCQIYISSHEDVVECSLLKIVNIGMALIDEDSIGKQIKSYQYLLEIPKVFLNINYDYLVFEQPNACVFGNRITSDVCSNLITFLELIMGYSQFSNWMENQGKLMLQHHYKKKELLMLCGINTLQVEERNGIVPCKVPMRYHNQYQYPDFHEYNPTVLERLMTFDLMTTKIDFIKHMINDFSSKTLIVSSKRLANSLRMHLKLLMKSYSDYFDDQNVIVVTHSEITEEILAISANVILSDMAEKEVVENIVSNMSKYNYNFYVLYVPSTFEETYLKQINMIGD